ncbi:YIP1 family protein [Roseovarius faecimaris]|nr:YIP1 family protein [Roseovarius faecimaris]
MTLTANDIQALIIETIRSPATAAQKLLSLRLPVNFLWMALVLMSVLNSIVYSLAIGINPPVDPQSGMMMVPAAFQSPLLFTLILFAALIVSVFALHRMGQAIGGGRGELGDILTVITWMQLLRLVLQIAVLVLGLVLPVLGGLLALIGSFYGLYVLGVLLKAAHRYTSLSQAFILMLAVFLTVVVGLALILAILSGLFIGGTTL